MSGRSTRGLVVALALASGALAHGFSADATGDALVVRLRLDQYRGYLGSHDPLDRLFCRGGWCSFLVSARELHQIEASGLDFEVSQPPEAPPPSRSSAKSGSNGRYHSYQETRDRLVELAERFPGLARAFPIGRSLEGRDVYAIRISDNVDLEEAEPNLYVIGCHHAREWISVEVPLLFAQHLLERHAEDAEVRRAVAGAQLYVVPLLNPDGLEFSIHHYRWWRKNRRYNGDMSWGVDLNRNYGFMWGFDDSGSSGDPESEAYRGPAAFSEPETEALRRFMLAHPPGGSVSYHNYSQVIMFPWGYTTQPTAHAAEMEAIAGEMSRRMLRVNGRRYEYGSGAEALYLTNGDLDDWIYGTFAIPAFTIELPPSDYLSGGFFTSDAEIDLSVSENLPALLYFANHFASD